MSFVVKLTRVSYVEIEANNEQQARDIVNQGIPSDKIEEGAGYWEVYSVVESECWV